MKNYSFDIETAPLPDASVLVQELYPFKAEDVKIGNLKDPDKIAAKIAEARDSHVATKLDKAQLNAHLSYICAIGLFDGDEYHHWYADDHMEESSVLDSFHGYLRNEKQLVQLMGWNCHGFDVPMIMQRSWKNRCKPLYPLLTNDGRPDRSVVDLMKVFCAGQYGQYEKLERAADFLSLQSPIRPDASKVTGKDFYKVLSTYRELAQQYFSADLYETYHIGKTILGI
jgi:hypothetical protein